MTGSQTPLRPTPYAGESIDNSLGTMFHISTMAAAGLGNLISDVMGLGLSNSIEVKRAS